MRDSGTGCRVLVSKRGCALWILCIRNQGLNTKCHTPNATWKSNKKRLKHDPHGNKSVGANSVRPSKKQVHDYNHCRTEQKLSYHACRGRRPRRPARRCNAVIVVSLMPNYFRGTLLWYSPIIQWARNIGLSHFCELANRNFAKPLQCWNYANSEHGRTLFAPTDIQASFYLRKIAPLFADFTLCRRIVKRCRFYTHISLSSNI